MTIYIIFFVLIIILALVLLIIANKNAYYNTYYGGKHIDSIKLTYSINGEDSGLDYSQLRKVLSENTNCHSNIITFVEVSKETKNVHLSIGGFDEKQFNERGKSAYAESFLLQHASLKNLLDQHRTLTEKTQLYYTMQNNIPLGTKYLPYTSILSNIPDLKTLFKNNDIYVLKINKSRQSGIKVITSESELNSAMAELGAKKNAAIISKYITNPLTIEGKKFHMRGYFLVYIRWGITYCKYIDDLQLILTAEEQYRQTDWLNEKIHLSGGKFTKKIYTWEKDIKSIINRTALLEFEKFKKTISQAIVLTGIRPFEEADSGYHILCADILFTDDHNVYLLEINRRGSFQHPSVDANFSYRLFSFIANYIIFPYFGLILPPDADAEFANGFHSSLASFSHSFIENRLNLLPINCATELELHTAHKIHFYKTMSLSILLEKSKQIWLIVKNGHIIGYASLLDLNKSAQSLLDLMTQSAQSSAAKTINIGISQSHQKRGIGTAIIALLIDIYAARCFPKNNYIYFEKMQHKSRVQFPIDAICKKLKFDIKGDLYIRLCKIKSPSNIKNLISAKLYYSSEVAIESNIISKYFTEKTDYSFVHLAIGKYQDDEYYISNGTKISANFLNQGAELKNILPMNKQIYGKKNTATNHIIICDQILVYKSGNIVHCYHYKKETFIKNSKSDKNPINNYDRHKFEDGHIEDINVYNTAVARQIQIIISNTAKLYPEQHAGYSFFSIFVCAGKILEVSSPNNINNIHTIKDMEFICRTVILPHFGISPRPISISYNCGNSIYDPTISLSTIDEKKYAIDKSGNTIGYIELSISDGGKIEITHIFLEPQYRDKKISTAVISQLLEILGARYAPLNPIVFFKHLAHIAAKLHFQPNEKIYSRLCRVYN